LRHIQKKTAGMSHTT